MRTVEFPQSALPILRLHFGLRSLTYLLTLPSLIVGDQPLRAEPAILTEGEVAVFQDYAALNIGQLKNMAKKARDEMQQKLEDVGGAGAAINMLVNGWSSGGTNLTDPTMSDFAVATIGQVKAVVRPFYERLIAVGQLDELPPWLAMEAVDATDYAVANVGQGKNAFGFEVEMSAEKGQNLTPASHSGSAAGAPLAAASGVPSGYTGEALSSLVGPVRAKGQFLSGHGATRDLPTEQYTDHIAALSAKFSVGDDGSANISVPIALPKGTSGVEPQLALGYSSNGGDGIAGLGWTLSGLGIISRTGSNYWKDGHASGVTFGPTDRFSFNGDRLSWVGSSDADRTLQEFQETGVMDGDIFYTEHHQFSRISYHRSSGSEWTDYWKVETKGGLTMYFGASAEAGSRIAPGTTASKGNALTWAVDRVEDRVGNYFAVNYARGGDLVGQVGWLDFVPKTILYTGNASAGVNPYHMIEFDYVLRKQPTFSYILGTKIGDTQVLKRINISSAPRGSATMQRMRYYELTYQEESQLTAEAETCVGLPRLVKIQEFARRLGASNGSGTSDFVAGQPTEFVWEESRPGWKADTDVEAQALAGSMPLLAHEYWGDWGFQQADLSGDGLDDIVWARQDGTPGAHSSGYRLREPGGGFTSNLTGELKLPVYTSTWGGGAAAMFLDVDANGMLDILSGGSYYSANSNNDQQVPPTRTIDKAAHSLVADPLTGERDWVARPEFKPPLGLAAVGVKDLGRRYLDINGDGFVDVLASYWDSQTDGTVNRYYGVWLNRSYNPSLAGDPNVAGFTIWDCTSEEALAYRKLFDVIGGAAYSSSAPGYIRKLNHDEQPAFGEILGADQNEHASGSRIFVDLNGDGLLDFVRSAYKTVSTAGAGTVDRVDRIYFNTGKGWRLAYDNTLSTADAYEPIPGTNTARLKEGFWPAAAANGGWIDDKWSFNDGGKQWVLPRAPIGPGPNYYTFGGTFHDVNGDGLLDYIMSRWHKDSKEATFNFVWLNTGDGWETEPSKDWVLPGYLTSVDIDSTGKLVNASTRSMLIDINHDGLLDFVSLQPTPTANYLSEPSTDLPRHYSGVWLNNGKGWGKPDYTSGSKQFTVKRDGLGNLIELTVKLAEGWTLTIEPDASAQTHGGSVTDYAWLAVSTVTSSTAISAFSTALVNALAGVAGSANFSLSGSNTITFDLSKYPIVERSDFGHDPWLGDRAGPFDIPYGRVIQPSPAWVIPELMLNNARDNPKLAHVIDLNSDGFADLVRSGSDYNTTTGVTTALTNKVYLHNAVDEVIKDIIEGDPGQRLAKKLTISYFRMNEGVRDSYTDNQLVYEPYTGVKPEGAAEVITAEPMVWMTSASSSVSEGEDAGLTEHKEETHYRYGGRLVHRQHGDLGFAWTETWSDGGFSFFEANGAPGVGNAKVKVRTEYLQEWPYAGLAKATLTSIKADTGGRPRLRPTPADSGWQVLDASETHFDVLRFGNGPEHARPYFIFADEAATASFDLDTGAQLSSKMTTTMVNDAGDVTNQTVVSSIAGQLASTVTTSSDYFNAPGSAWDEAWILSRLKSTTVTYSAPGSAAITKKSSFEYYPPGHEHAGMLYTETTEPDGAWTKKEHVYDSVGNTRKVITSAAARNGYTVAPRETETAFDERKRFPDKVWDSFYGPAIASSTEYDHLRSTATSSTDANGLTASSEYDAWGTTLSSTSPNGVKSIKFVRLCTIAELPQIVYYTYAQTEGSTASISYHDKHGRVHFAESVGFHGNILRARTLYNDEGEAIASSTPYFGDAPAGIQWSEQRTDELGRNIWTTEAGSSKSGAQTSTITRTYYEGHVTRAEIVAEGRTETTRTETKWMGNDLVSITEDTRITDPTKNKVINYTTVDGLPWKTVGPDGRAFEKVYSTDGRRELVQTIDPDHGTTTLTYDGFGQLRSSSHPVHGNTVLGYDDAGRVTQKITPEGTYTTVYDSPTGVASGNAGPQRWIGAVYATSGPLVDGAGGTHSQVFTYDGLGRPTSVTETIQSGSSSQTFTSGTTYDDSNQGRVDTVTDAGGFTVRHGYNALGFSESTIEVSGGVKPGRVLWQLNQVDAWGAVRAQTYAEGVVLSAEYEERTGRLKRQRSFVNGQVIQDNSYESDSWGLIHSRTRHAIEANEDVNAALPERKEYFGYDGLDRLTHVKLGSSSFDATPSMSYDTWGNLMTKADIGAAYHYTAGNAHRLDHVMRSMGGQTRKHTFQYDAVGRVTVDEIRSEDGATLAGRRRSYEYTSFGQIRRIESIGGAAVDRPGEVRRGFLNWSSVVLTFTFDVGGERLRQVKQTSGLTPPTEPGGQPQAVSERTVTTYLGGYETEEVWDLANTSGGQPHLLSTEKRHYFGGGMIRKRADRKRNATSPMDLNPEETSTFLYLSDSLGSTEAVLELLQDGNQTRVRQSERQAFDAWGSRRDATTYGKPEAGIERALGSRHRKGYTGHEGLEDVGIIHMNGRIYDPELARFLSPDPVLQEPSNTQNYACYSYVFNNPLSFTDPSGATAEGVMISLQRAVAKSFMERYGQRYNIKTMDQALTYRKLHKIGGHQLLKAFQSYRKKHGFGKAKKEFYKKLGIKKKKWWKIAITVVAVVLIAVVAWYAAPAIFSTAAAGSTAGAAASASGMAAGLATAAVQGAALGAGLSASMTAIQGGGVSDILQAGLKGAVTGAISGALTFGIGHGIFEGATGFGSAVAKASLHGAVQGGISEASGGSFREGFISGAASSVIGGLQHGEWGRLNSSITDFFSSNPIGSLAANVMVGGTVSEISGGKFANGAMSAAFVHLFNQLAGSLNPKEVTPSDEQKKAFEITLKKSQLAKDMYDFVTGEGWTIKYAAQLRPTGSPGANGTLDHNNKILWLKSVTPPEPGSINRPEYLGTPSHEMYHIIEGRIMAGGVLGANSVPQPLLKLYRSIYHSKDGFDGIEFRATRAANQVLKQLNAAGSPLGPYYAYAGKYLPEGTLYKGDGIFPPHLRR